MPKANRPTSITCARCGAEKAVGQRGPVPVYCSDACRAGVVHDRRAAIECAHCHQPATARAGTAYCSAACRDASRRAHAKHDGRYDQALLAARQKTQARRAASARPCPYCGDPMNHPRRKQCGKPECKRAFDAERARDWRQDFTAREGKRYSSKYRERELQYETNRRSERAHWRTTYPEAAALADARRRMIVEQATKGEPFAPRDVFERDQWTCGLCRHPVDPGLAWPHPMSASVDHVVPLSRGGEHSLDNVQCAHLRCNCIKGDQEIEIIGEFDEG
jgi:5-methylcytosine-specific restriction endonuclease McrA